MLTSIPKGIGPSDALLRRDQVVRRKFAYFVIGKVIYLHRRILLEVIKNDHYVL